MDISRGDVLLVPHGTGRVRVEGDVTVIRCMPPDGTPAA
jgi:mannose-6-phosphate isomerase